ncbi:MAG: hypothetical protein M3447_01015 [Acidobacteriota bacterium]|nr:hypothetical protein [Acidobacteriota bacterium]
MRTLRAMCGVALMLMLALTMTPMPASAQEDAQGTANGQLQEESSKRSSGNGKIVGVWDVRVINRDCQTGEPAATPPLLVMNMFNRGGTLLETGSGLPTRRGPGLGTWQYIGGRSYSSVFRFFRFNADGTFAGTRRVARTIELSKDANEFTATASFEVFDANDNLIQIGCATETATRLE